MSLGRGMVSNELYLHGGKTISNESCFKGEKLYQINYAFEVKKCYNKKIYLYGNDF